MLILRCLPLFVRLLLRGLPGVFRYRHQLVFSWLLLMQIIAPGRNTLKQLARYTPLHIAEWHFRRLLSASYWSFRYYSDGSLRQMVRFGGYQAFSAALRSRHLCHRRR